MVDVTNDEPIIDVANTEASADANVVKKQRKPRLSKAAVEATAASAPAKLSRGRKKQSEQPKEVSLMPTRIDVAARKTRKSAIRSVVTAEPPKRSEQTPEPMREAMDEMADLIQLEEENKSLRKTLAEKLRAENADLRKRLGLD